MDAEVIIIGGGLSGLSAAYQLWRKDSNFEILVLEAKERLGGRTLTVEINGANGRDKWDLGGQWVGSTQPHIMDLIDNLGIKRYKQYVTGLKYQQLGENTVRSYNSDIPPLSWYSLIQIQLLIGKIDRLRMQIKDMDPMTSPIAKELDAITTEQFINKEVSTQGARDAVASSGRCIFGAEPSQMSMLYYLMYINGVGGMDALISAKENIGGQEFKIKGGAQQISELLSSKIGANRIILGHPVVSVTQHEDHVILGTTKGKQYKCQKVIMAIPPNQAGKIQYTPALPAEKCHVFDRMPVGHLIKFIVTYKTTFWRENGASGEVVTNGGPSVTEGCDTGPLCITFDATSAEGNPAIVGFIGGDQALQYMKVSKEARKKAVLYSLCEFFGAAAGDCIDYVEKDWQEEPYNGGCPVCIGTTGIMQHYKSALQDPFQRIHFAGTESANLWAGFLSGAVQAGYRAANEVLYDLRPAAVSREDLVDTCYDTSKRNTTTTLSQTQNGHKLIKYALVLGTVCLVGYIVVKKGYLKKYL